jgi:hypothetical protein
MAFFAPCGCLSEGDEHSGITEHREGCSLIEDLLTRTGSAQADPWRSIVPIPAQEREVGAAAKALAASYERYADELAAIEEIRRGPRNA